MKLTEYKIKSLKPKDKKYKTSDGKGLFLLITPAGSKSWRFNYRYSDKYNCITYGCYPDVSIKEARDKHNEAKSLLKQGFNPKRAFKADNSFKTIALQWIDVKRDSWSEVNTVKVINSLKLDIFPAIGEMDIIKIEAPMILNCLRNIEARGSYDTASRVLQRINRVFSYAIACGVCKTNPAIGLTDALKKGKGGNFKALRFEEVGGFLKALNDSNCKRVTKIGLLLIAHTFVRRNELVQAAWSEVDFEKKQWVIPASRMKGGIEHIIPLSNQVVVLLKELQELTGYSGLLFPGRNDNQFMSGDTLLFALHDCGYKGKATVHGFRSTASTHLNESQKFSFDAIEKQLAHHDTNKIRAAYNKSKYLDERKQIMQWYSDELERATLEE